MVGNWRIPDAQTARPFTDADIVVLPHIEASQSGVLAIADALAEQVIVTDIGELGHPVEGGVSAVIAPAGDAAALAEAILSLAGDGEPQTRLGDAGRRAAEGAASPEAVAEKAMQTCPQVARSKIRPTPP